MENRIRVLFLDTGNDDPPSSPRVPEHKKNILDTCRRVRDEIKEFLKTRPASLERHNAKNLHQ